MYDENEPFSNPIAPAHHEPAKAAQGGSGAAKDNSSHHPLTNDDFRKLMMTPRPGASGSMAASVRREFPASVRGGRKPILNTTETNENKTKKKKFFQAMKKQEEDTLAELALKYRDRARERRDGDNPDYQKDDPTASIPAYRAVAPDVKSVVDAAEKRKQMIEESKFLGGDMEHTHLVKGLDYALLQKVKAEIQIKDDSGDEDEQDEGIGDVALGDSNNLPDVPDVPANDGDEVKSVMANNIMNLLFKKKAPERNELFLPSRMAYHVDLEDECADDIPTTVIRSRADCPNWDSMATLSTNDIVINKLTQILSYLRQGGSAAKKKKKEKIPLIGEPIKESREQKSEKSKLDDSIYGDIGDYIPTLEKKERSRDSERHESSRRARDESKARERGSRSHSYFEKSSSEIASTSHEKSRPTSYQELARAAGNPGSRVSVEEAAKVRGKLSTLDATESYAECYPGAPENDDAILDSDDEVDFTKMDSGVKKGAVNRWDFDTAEEYGDYMSNKEAMPKAAFQYGLKMADGRKTKGNPAKKDEKTKLDRDFQKINAIITKRKAEAVDGGRKVVFQTPSHQPNSKRHKN